MKYLETIMVLFAVKQKRIKKIASLCEKFIENFV